MKTNIVILLCIVSFFSCKKEEKVDEVPSIEFTYSNNIGTMPRAVNVTALGIVPMLFE